MSTEPNQESPRPGSPSDVWTLRQEVYEIEQVLRRLHASDNRFVRLHASEAAEHLRLATFSMGALWASLSEGPVPRIEQHALNRTF